MLILLLVHQFILSTDAALVEIFEGICTLHLCFIGTSKGALLYH